MNTNSKNNYFTMQYAHMENNVQSIICITPHMLQSLHTAVGRNEAIYKTFTFHGIRFGTTYQQKFQ